MASTTGGFLIGFGLGLLSWGFLGWLQPTMEYGFYGWFGETRVGALHGTISYMVSHGEWGMMLGFIIVIVGLILIVRARGKQRR